LSPENPLILLEQLVLLVCFTGRQFVWFLCFFLFALMLRLHEQIDMEDASAQLVKRLTKLVTQLSEKEFNDAPLSSNYLYWYYQELEKIDE